MNPTSLSTPCSGPKGAVGSRASGVPWTRPCSAGSEVAGRLWCRAGGGDGQGTSEVVREVMPEQGGPGLASTRHHEPLHGAVPGDGDDALGGRRPLDPGGPGVGAAHADPPCRHTRAIAGMGLDGVPRWTARRRDRGDERDAVPLRPRPFAGCTAPGASTPLSTRRSQGSRPPAVSSSSSIGATGEVSLPLTSMPTMILVSTSVAHRASKAGRTPPSPLFMPRASRSTRDPRSASIASSSSGAASRPARPSSSVCGADVP